MKRQYLLVVLTALLVGSLPAFAEDVDLEIIHRIKDQAFNHSQVMNYMHLLADENGARMSGSPGYRPKKSYRKF